MLFYIHSLEFLAKIRKGEVDSEAFRRAQNWLFSSHEIKKFCDRTVTIGVNRGKLAFG